MTIVLSEDRVNLNRPAIKSGPLTGVTARGVVVLDENDRVLHSELVGEIANEPDYAAALAALGK